EIGELRGEHLRGSLGWQGAHIGDGNRFERRVPAVQDLEYALLALVLIQTKQSVEGSAADIGRLGRREELFVNRHRSLPITRTSQHAGATKSRLGQGGLQDGVGVSRQCLDGSPGGLV